MITLTPVPQAAPLAFNVPIGPYGILACIEVSGDNRQNVSLSFTGGNVVFTPTNKETLPIVLDPQHTTASGIEAAAGPQTLNITQVTYTPPSTNATAVLMLTGSYTNQQGQGGWSYPATQIASWRIMDAVA
jgi:hypothetical protein